MTELERLFEEYGTDKSRHGYAPVYEALLMLRRLDRMNLVEVGIGTMIPDAYCTMKGYVPSHYRPGGSLRAWRDWLVNAHVFGVDFAPDTQFSEARIATVQGDSRDPNICNLLDDAGARIFDVVVDDGSHKDDDQLRTLLTLWPHLAADGIYFIEDIPAPAVATNGLQPGGPLLSSLPTTHWFHTVHHDGGFMLVLRK